MNSIKHAKAVISCLVLILIHSLMGIHAQTQAPYGGIPRTIPGQISSIDFDEGGEGIAYHDETPNDKDFYRNESVDIEHGEAHAVMLNKSEWLEYTVNVATGTYDMSIRLGAKTIGGQIKAFLEDSLIATFNIPSSAGSRFGALQTHTVKNIVLPGGSSKVLKLESVNGDFLFEWIKFQPSGTVKPQTPFGEIPWTVPGRIWAFDFDNGGEGIAYHDLTPFNEGNWRLRMDENVDIEMKDDGYFITSFKNGEWLEYTVNMVPGAYDIGISVASPSVGKQLKAYLNDSLIAIFDIPKTGNYKHYKTFWVNNIVLPGGTGRILRLENVNGDFNFEWIKFEPVKTLPVRTIPGIVQAEDFDLGGEGIGYHDVTPFNDLGLYRPSEGVDISYCYCTSDTVPDYWIGWFKHGEWLKYTVNVDSGIYDISIRVASVTTGKQLKAYLDETLIATFDIPNTGNYVKYQTFTLHNIALPKGAGKKLRLENVNNDFDFDWIRFEPSAQNQTPYEGTPQTIPGVIEAENYDEGGEGVAYHDITPTNEGWWRTEEGVDVKAYYCGDDYFVGAVGWFKNGEWMEYTVNVETGIYNISIRTGTAKTGRKLNVYLDNNLITTLSVPKTGIQSKEDGFDYYTVQTYTLNNISITGGAAKVLRLENVNGDFDIDWIEFERVGTIKTQYPNNGVPGTIPGTIEAEDFDNGGEGVAYHDVTPINEGGCEYRANESVDVRLKASVDGFGRIGWIGKFRHGEWMEYTVNVDSGTYDISIMVGAEKAGKQLKAYLNDTLIATFNIPQTGGFTVWQTVSLKNIHISGGTNKILKLENVHGDFNLSWIKFERSGEIKTQAPYGGTPRSVPGIIEAEEFDEGGEGVAYHDVTPDGGWWLRTDEGVDIIRKNDYDYFFSVGRFKNGEWMEYTVDVDSGTYNISINVASVSPGKQLKAYLNDSLFATFDIPNTGGYKKYMTSIVYNINLPGGSGKILKLENVNNDFDIDWIRFERAATKTQAPYGGVSRTIPGIIQAEDFDTGGEGVAYHDVSSANEGGGYRTTESVDIKSSYCRADNITRVGLFKNGEWMEYTVDVDSGTYYISIRVAAEEAGKQLKAYLSDSLVATFDIPNTGNYFRYQTYTIKNIVLAGGTSKILKLENVNNDFNLDWIEFEHAGTKTQAPYGGIARTIPGTINAEDFDEGGEGIAYHDDTPINSGGCWGRGNESVDINSNDNPNYVGWFKPGEWMEYTVNVDSGIYDINIRTTSIRTGNQLKAYLNDSLIATFDIPKTGSYDNWQTCTVKNIVLSGGNSQILKLENVKGVFDLYWIRFEPAGIIKTQAPYGGIARTIPGTIEAEDFDEGGEGIAYHDVSPYNEGDYRYRLEENVDISYISDGPGSRMASVVEFKHGEWMEYTVNVEPGVYDIIVWVSALETGKQLKAYLNDSLIAIFEVPNTGDYLKYQIDTISNVVLSGGNSQILKLENVNADFNFKCIKFERSDVKIQAPYEGITRTIPGIIGVLDFDEGGEGIAYHDMSPYNEGDWWVRMDENVDIDYISFGPGLGLARLVEFKNGEWLEYTVNVNSGIYDITIFVIAEETGKQLKAYLDDDLIATFDIPIGGSYYTYQSVTLSNIFLPGGNSKVLKLENVNGEFNLGWIEFHKRRNSPASMGEKTTELKSGSLETQDSKAATLSQNTPNPFNRTTRIEYFLPDTVRDAVIFIHNIYGVRIKSIPVVNKGNGAIIINDSELQPGMYIYSLFADGQEVGSKRMLLIK